MDMEIPRLVFAFGHTQESYFIGCGEDMEWNKIPAELESVLINQASEVLALSLGENGTFYCRYISKGGDEQTVSGNLPQSLSFLLSCWFANPYERPHVAFGPSGSYFFQSSTLSTWEKLPHQLDTLLNELRESPDVALHPRSLSLGSGDGFVFLTGDDGEFPMWDNVDPELAHRLSGDEDKIVVDSVSLSLVAQEDYLVIFSDGSVFYSVPDTMTPIVQRFVYAYHMALADYEHAIAREYDSVPPSPRVEMAVAMAAASTAGKNGQSSFSLELPDGILDWDETVLTKFIEEAVGSSAKSCASTPVGSTSHEKTFVRHNPYPLGNLASIRGMTGAAPTIDSGWERESDYQSDTFESRGFKRKGGFDALGLQLSSTVIEL